MKKKLIAILGIMLIIVIGTSFVTAATRKKEKEEEKLTIVTSFYPMYILAKNLTQGTNIDVINLTEYKTGCLHDYQLTTSDMKKLENADIFIMNGGGMESFMEDILKSYPNLPIINASEGIAYLTAEGHNHEEEADSHEDEAEDNHEGEEYNAHVWLNLGHYLKEIKNVQEGLKKFDLENAKIFEENGIEYSSKIETLKDNIETNLADVKEKKVVIFHDSFAYLAQELGLKVIHTVNLDGETALSAGDIAEVIDEVKENQVKVLFTEEQYSTSIAENIASETGAKVYVIDSLVTGDMDGDSYINGMKQNMEVLKQALLNQ
ncbi:metal ABC transporter substrate-binding protein [Anaerocolumna aminovalerica]|uniref:metal ABC transporter substrate-binding protein n=1 Tax=Anaerocolumna aminovalerica TaxID=1527 RepID=UPI000BE286AC|nr:metal ABC transporter substrate-binding protein [Anaerocolumna aminovalerica]